MNSKFRSLRVAIGLCLATIGALIVTLAAHPATNAAAKGAFLQEPLPSTPPNTALHFDGADDVIDVGDISVLKGVSQYTIEAWVKFESLSQWDTVYAKRVSASDRAAVLQVYDDSGHIAVAVDHGYFYTASPLVTGKWYHTAVVFDGTQANSLARLKLYIDGSPAALIPFFGPDTVPATTSTTNSRFVLGAEYSETAPIDANSNLGAFFNGWIDEVRIWSLPRTQIQIQADKDQELTGSESGLEIYYNFSDGVPCGDNTSLTSLSDAAGAAQNGLFWHFALKGVSSNYCDESLIKKLFLPLAVRGSE